MRLSADQIEEDLFVQAAELDILSVSGGQLSRNLSAAGLLEPVSGLLHDSFTFAALEDSLSSLAISVGFRRFSPAYTMPGARICS